MSIRHRTAWAYVVAALGAVAFVATNLAVSDLKLRSFLTSLEFIFSIVAAGMLGGAIPCLAATAAFMVALAWFMEPQGSFRVENTSDVLRIASFSILGAAVGLVSAGLQVARSRVEERQRRLEIEIEERRKADLLKDEFLATLAHELRNPLAPISNAVQLMQMKGPLDPDVELARETIERQIKQMSRLVDDLLDVSRINHKTLQLRPTTVSLEQIVQSAVETVAPLISTFGHELQVEGPNEAAFIEGDLVRLTQVVANLLDNAVKYTERGGKISLVAERQGNDAVVTIKDNGIGISADMLPKVFDMFAQADRSIARSRGGLGIGLTLVKRIVELHKGTISVHSDGTNCGSRFTVRIPLSANAPAGIAANRDGDERSALDKLRVLVVDDNKDSAQTLAMLLTAYGCQVQTAYDGVEAVERATSARPQIILLDLGLPKLSGYEVCERIRQDPQSNGTHIVAVTGWGQEDDRRRTREAGFDHHLVKPVDHDALKKLLADFQSNVDAPKRLVPHA